MKQEVVKELLQQNCNEENLLKEFENIAFNQKEISKIQEKYNQLYTLLGSAGTSKSIAQYIAENILK